MQGRQNRVYLSFSLMVALLLSACDAFPPFDCTATSQYYLLLRANHARWHEEIIHLGSDEWGQAQGYRPPEIERGVILYFTNGGNRLLFEDRNDPTSVMVFMVAMAPRANNTTIIGNYGFMYSPITDVGDVDWDRVHSFEFIHMGGRFTCYRIID